MRKNMFTRGLLCVLALGALSTSCIGPFNTTRRIHTWNREIENRWVGEAVYLPFRFVIMFAAVGDLLIFNSLEFWGADNWIDPPAKARIDRLREQDEARARESRGEAEPEAETSEE